MLTSVSVPPNSDPANLTPAVRESLCTFQVSVSIDVAGQTTWEGWGTGLELQHL